MLLEVQDFLAEAFRRREPVVDDPAVTARSAVHVAGNARVSPAEQVDIYRRQFWLRHVDCLREDYPALLHLLGDDGFQALCEGYLQAFPPKTPSLRDLGADFPAFAASYTGFPSDRQSLAVDLARYENAFVDVFDGAELAPLDLGKIQGVSDDFWSRARLVVHPHLALVQAHHKVHLLRYLAKHGEPPELTEFLERREEPYFIALFRLDDVVRYEVLPREAFLLLVELRAGYPLTEALARVLEALGPEAGAGLETKVAGFFQMFAENRFIVDVVDPSA